MRRWVSLNEKIKIKNILKWFIYVIIISAGILFIYYLQNTSIKKEENEMVWSIEVNESIGKERILVSENDQLKLFFQEDTATVFIEDKKTKEIWRSNPEDASEDEVAFGLNKTNLLSQLIIGYVDEQKSSFVVNSHIASVTAKTFEYEIKDNGVYVKYYFKDTGFEIPVYYGINDDYFTAKILNDKIVEHGPYKITDITFLPYMASGNKEDEGYIVLPDGSGSLMEFNNNKQSYLAYSEAVYGRDLALNTNSKTRVKKNVTMPIFGIKKNDQAILAVINQGEYQADINAEVSGKSTSNNIAYTKINYMYLDTHKLFANTASEEISQMWSEQFNKFPEYEVRYYFLEKDSDYTDMALRYQRYLIEEKGMVELGKSEGNKSKVNVDLLGSVDKIDTFLGIPYKTLEVLTSYEDVGNVAKDLGAMTDLSIRYLGGLKGGLKGKVLDSVKFEKKLGGKSKFNKMENLLEELEVSLYPSFDIVNMYRTGNGYKKLDSTRNIHRSAAYQYDYLLSTGVKNPKLPPSYLISPGKTDKLTSKLTKSLHQNQWQNVALAGMPSMVYSNYKKDGVSRNETGTIFEQSLFKFKEEIKTLVLDSAFGYGLPYADVITNVPVYSSEFDMVDRSIPFYQTVMSGYATLYSEPINMMGDINDYLLKLAETGVNPSYMFIANDPSLLINTNYAYMYSNGYMDWKDELLETAKRFSDLSIISNEKIIGHKELSENVFMTSFSNGYRVYTNYNNEDVTTDGLTIGKKDFRVRGDN